MNGDTYDIDGVPTKIGYQVHSRHDCFLFFFVFSFIHFCFGVALDRCADYTCPILTDNSSWKSFLESRGAT